MTDDTWTNNWSDFVHEVCGAKDAGLSDIQITEKFGHRRVTWSGIVNECRDYYGLRAITVRMPCVPFQLQTGKRGQAVQLVLSVREIDLEPWENVKAGDPIVFETEVAIVSPLADPFRTAGIEWTELGHDRTCFTVQTCNSRLVKIEGDFDSSSGQ